MKKQKLILRLDDAAERMDIDKWQRIEDILDKFEIKPLVGVIPCCKDPMMDIYETNPLFWDKVHGWKEKGWAIAMHGFRHVYDTKEGGLNPVNEFSEFAGHSLDEQRMEIREGYKRFQENGLLPKYFFAPGHTFDDNTLNALISETPIRIVSDTIAWDAYTLGDLTFIPQQSGNVRKLPFKTCTFAYHPNTMDDNAFESLESFLRDNKEKFISADDISPNARKRNLGDEILKIIYFLFRRIRRITL